MFKATLRGRAITLSKTLLTAGLLGGAALLGSPAKAGLIDTNSCSFGADTTHPLCNSYSWGPDYMQLGDKIFRFDPTLSNFQGTSGTLNFTNTSSNLWTVNLDFDPATSILTQGQYAYSLSIDPLTSGGRQFALVDLDSTCNSLQSGDSCTVNKFLNGATTAALSSPSGDPDGPVAISGTTVQVIDTFSTAGQGTLDSISNNFSQTRETTPGPLPLLGAGAAFGFSRQLRKRIRKYTLA